MQSSFHIQNYEIKNNSIHFAYEVKLPDGTSYSFIERLEFENDILLQKVPKHLLESLHLILAISYYKLFLSRRIVIHNFSLTKDQAQFWDSVYTKGLGELFYKNNIDFRELVKFPYIDTSVISVNPPAGGGNLENRSPDNSGMTLLPVGGGKDSIVSAELLKKENRDFTCFTLNGGVLQNEVIHAIGAKNINVVRKLDSQLFDLVKSGVAYNGHIPITAIYSFISLLVAWTCDFTHVVMSNEKSANYGNVEYLGYEINHQWSKSAEFETMFCNYVKKYITSDIAYASILRQYNEFEIVEIFSRYPKYFHIFSSCNRNFKLEKDMTQQKWCGECPKCAFVFAMFAAHVPKETVVSIFGKNLFADESLVALYRDLLGYTPVKPFECVGTPSETKSAFDVIQQKGDYREDSIMKMYSL